MHTSVLDLQKGLELFRECCTHAGDTRVVSGPDESPVIETDRMSFESLVSGERGYAFRITIQFEALLDQPGEMETSVCVEVEDSEEIAQCEFVCVVQASEEVCTWYLDDESSLEDVLVLFEKLHVPVELRRELEGADLEFIEHGFMMRLVEAMVEVL